MDEETSLPNKLLMNIINYPEKLKICKRWLVNFKLTAQSLDLLAEDDKPLNQMEFISYFLCFLRKRASKVENGVSHTPEEKSLQSLNKVNAMYQRNDEIKQNEDEGYFLNFPNLNESAAKSCIKSTRRINPTPIPKDIEEGIKSTRRINPTPIPKDIEEGKKKMKNYVFSPITEDQEKLFKRRFSECSHKSNLSYIPKKKERNCPPKKEAIVINEYKLRALNAVVDIYSYLLKNSHVTSIAKEVKFLLHIFSLLDDYEDQQSLFLRENDISNILLSSYEWEFFCVEVFVRLDSIMMKMGVLIRNFLHTRIKAWQRQSHQSSSEISQFLKKIKNSESVCSVNLVSFQKLATNQSKILPDPSILAGVKNKFIAIEENWVKNCSEDELWTNLDYLRSFRNNISLLNSFGKVFVDSLIRSLEESCTNNINFKQKFSKLTTRIAMPFEMEEHKFTCNEFFHKLVIDFCFGNCPEHLLYIKFWVFNTIKLLSERNSSSYGATMSADTRITVISTIKIKITLAKFLGYIIFSNDSGIDIAKDSEEQILETIHGEFMPPVDIKEFLLQAWKAGELIDAIPWMVQYLCMADKRITNQPYYSDFLLIIISLHLAVAFNVEGKDCLKNILNGERDSVVKINIAMPNLRLNQCGYEFSSTLLRKSSLLFIKLWTGKLFDNKVLGEDFFFKLFHKYISMQDLIKPSRGLQGNHKGCLTMDGSTIINDETFLILCSHFSKIKYWESAHSLTSTKNIRPSLINSTGDSNIDVQGLLEEQFLKDHQNMADIIDFASNKIFSVFQTAFMSELKDISDNPNIAKENTSSRSRYQFLIEDSYKRIVNCIKALIPDDIESSVFKVTTSICYKRLNREINKWLSLQGYESVLDKEGTFTNLESRDSSLISSSPISCSCTHKKEASTFQSDNISNHRLSTFFKNLVTIMRKINEEERFEQDVHSVLNDILIISHELYSKTDRQNLEFLYYMSWNYVLLIVTSQPQSVTKEFFKKISLFWQQNYYGDYQKHILCPHVIKSSGIRNKSHQKLIAQNIGQLIFWVVERDILNYEGLEEQCVAVLQHSWNEAELDFILMTLSEINNVLVDSKVENSVTLMTFIDSIAESINGIKLIED